MYPIKKYSWILDNNQDKLLSSPRKSTPPSPSMSQDKLLSSPRTPSNLVASLESQIEALTSLVDSIKQSCEFVIEFCNDYESMKRYVEIMEGKESK